MSVTPDEVGLRYSSPVANTSYGRDVVELVRAGVMGASIGFQVVRDVYDPRPSKTASPDGTPVRRVEEAKLRAISIVSFPAYSSSTAAMRSSTDRRLLEVIEPERCEPQPASVAALAERHAPAVRQFPRLPAPKPRPRELSQPSGNTRSVRRTTASDTRSSS